MTELIGKPFELTDGITTRKAQFKIPDAETGLLIISDTMASEGGAAIKALATHGCAHLVLLEDKAKGIPEHQVNSLKELSYTFKSPFIGVKVGTEFEKAIAPFLEPLKL